MGNKQSYVEETYDDGGSYFGFMKQGMKHGHGCVIYPDGTLYDGDFAKNLYHGLGKLTFANGNVYNGQWREDEIAIKGKYIYANGSEYNGGWLNQKRHGHGRFTFVNGDVYVGEYRDGLQHGNGKYTSAGGHMYEGQWAKNMRHGQGRFVYASGAVYDGVWFENKRGGYGTFKSDDGDVYKGEWRDDQRSGQGRYEYNDGDVYEGSYLNDQRHGAGRFLFESGNKYEGRWQHNLRHGKGRYTWADGSWYEGMYELDEQHGHGVYVDRVNSIQYDGEFVAGERHGKGKYTHAHGSVHIGEFANGEPEGRGVYKHPDGLIVDAMWVNGLPLPGGRVIGPDGKDIAFDYTEIITRKQEEPGFNWWHGARGLVVKAFAHDKKTKDIKQRAVTKEAETYDDLQGVDADNRSDADSIISVDMNVPLEECRWYHADIDSREVAVDRLNDKEAARGLGSFLVRPSATQPGKDYSISLLVNGGVTHLKIEGTATKQFLLTGFVGVPFDSVPELVHFCCNNNINTARGPLQPFTYGVPNPEAIAEEKERDETAEANLEMQTMKASRLETMAAHEDLLVKQKLVQQLREGEEYDEHAEGAAYWQHGVQLCDGGTQTDIGMDDMKTKFSVV